MKFLKTVFEIERIVSKNSKTLRLSELKRESLNGIYTFSKGTNRATFRAINDLKRITVNILEW